ncbi:peptidyl-prolyl cis-trans isomerase CYP21-2-like [Coccinella septempunctata]|uniref:peptidyl-prolyl cis-trans isomerase CYP21-2-like n=1 Tax=Coccinella septempunctata TaxID=41139 RepID=UPI001D093DDB|nr:peptidyl-prolyl cis-trans isomerase CYP21-2-like [Coccinella septempunctata]
MSKYRKCGYKSCSFEPKKSPRISPYLHQRDEWMNDLKMYNQHLKRIFEARPLVDASPLKMNPKARLGLSRLEHDANRMHRIDEENKLFMKKLIEIVRNGGVVDHINNQIYCTRVTKWRGEKARRNELNEENRKMLKRLLVVKSYYRWKEHKKEWKENKRVLKKTAKFPLIVMKKTSLDDTLQAEPTISSTLGQLGQRLQCFLDFRVKGGENLGRVVIEIYHDHVPVTACNFFHLCRGDYGKSYKNCPVHRIAKNKYLETGDITNGTGTGGSSIYGESFDEEKHTLKHTRAGVLSMIRVGNQKNNSKFVITFVNMQEWDRKNVVFGKVIQGAGVLMKINGYGREIGKPLKQIFISNCGEMPSCDCLFKHEPCL